MARAHALVSHLSVRRGGRLVLDDISFPVGPGITAILGPNGAGKTTLIEALASPSRDIGLMPQRWRALPGFTVRDSVAYAGWLKGVGRREMDAAVSAAVAAVDLGPLIDRRATRLSGGEQQRVGLAESIVHAPSLLLLDEPTVGLDPEQRSIFRSSLQAGLASTVLLSTHLIDDVAAIAEHVVVIDEGSVAFAGTLDELAAEGESGSGMVVQLETAYRNVLKLHRAAA